MELILKWGGLRLKRFYKFCRDTLYRCPKYIIVIGLNIKILKHSNRVDTHKGYPYIFKIQKLLSPT